MRRFLICLAACLLLPFTTGCDVDVNVSVEAQALLSYYNGDTVLTEVVPYGPYTHRNLSDRELRILFTDLIRGYNPDFQMANLCLHFTDNITHQDMGEDWYGVLYSSHTGEYEFADLPSSSF